MGAAARGVLRSLLWASRAVLREPARRASLLRAQFSTATAGEQPIVTDAIEALRQHVDQEAPDELVGRQCHGLAAGRPFDPIVLVV